ncbi:MAG TPA: hypothetical protein VFT41_03145 [Gemmatimonadaceae bacterium]|nr:hypothetical protein [Gemmatimonadaceae bacterium]
MLHKLCRESDAAVFRYVDSSYSDLGKIAQPRDSDGSTWNLNPTPISISGDLADADLIAGTTLHKVGATTSWTYGTITGTCLTVQVVDLNGNYTGKYFLCQYDANFSMNLGDSGSPVFLHASNGTAHFAGLLWGTGGYFSPLEGIQYDLGTLSPL